MNRRMIAKRASTAPTHGMAVGQALHIRDGKVVGYHYSISPPRLTRLFSDVKWLWQRLREHKANELPKGTLTLHDFMSTVEDPPLDAVCDGCKRVQLDPIHNQERA